MGWQKFVKHIRMLYLGFIDLNRTVYTVTRNIRVPLNFMHLMSTYIKIVRLEAGKELFSIAAKRWFCGYKVKRHLLVAIENN